MPEDGSLTLGIDVELDDSGIVKLFEELGDTLETKLSSLVATFGLEPDADSATQAGEDAIEIVQDAVDANPVTVTVQADTSAGRQAVQTDADALRQAGEDAIVSTQTKDEAKGWKDTLFKMLTGQSAEGGLSEETKKQTALLKLGQEVTQAGIKGLTTITQGSFEFLEMIYNYLKQSAPLLQAIESMFNLAVQLFFMPLGTKLAEVMLPAVLELVDNVVDMWDAMEGMSLSEMVEYMMSVGVEYFADFFLSIGEQLSTQEGLLGAIGNLMTSIGDFLQNDAAGLLEAMVSIVTIVVDNLKTIISMLAALYTMQMTMQLLSLYMQAVDGLGIFSTFAKMGVATLAAGAVGGLTAYGVTSYLGMAEGGYVPATDGGQLRILGEGGEGEYVIPESRVGSLGGTTNNYYYFNGYTDEDVKRMIQSEVSSQISQSRIRGSFRCRWLPARWARRT